MKTPPIPVTTAMRLAAFVRRWTNVANVGDTPANRGQCVGLVEVWTDSLGLPHVWGNAKDLLVDAPVGSYSVVKNGPVNYPHPGDVVVFDASWGGGYGHTGIAVAADARSLTLFQQNDPEASRPHLKRYSYVGVSGWLHPLVTP